MELAAALARAAVGWVFLVSGALKLRSRTWPGAARSFGTPAPLVPVVPWVEVVLGALLVAQVGGRVAALAALAVLLVFTAAIVRRLVRGERVPCGCFGETAARPVSGATVVRNLVLCGLCLVGALGA